MYAPSGMGMTVLSDSLWVSYDASPLLQTLLPPGLRLSPISLFEGEEEEKERLLFNSYRVRSPFMRGHRLEVVTVAEEERTREKHFVILDCLTDCLHWTPSSGILLPNAVCSTASSLSVSRHYVTKVGDAFRFAGKLGRKTKVLTRKFAVDCNRKCFFGKSPSHLSLLFDEASVLFPVTPIPLPSIQNSLWKEMRKGKETHAFVHTFPMTYYMSSTK